MCDTDANFTTIAGPQDALHAFSSRWQDLRLASDQTLRTLGVSSMEFPTLAGVDEAEVRADVGALAVAWHAAGDGPRVAGLLNAHFRAEADDPVLRRLLSEPGHYFAGDARGPASGVGTLDQGQVTKAKRYVPSISGQWSSQPRIALLDTGDARSQNKMRDVTQAPWNSTGAAKDANGHGTAAADAIRAVAPNADIHPFRVLDASNSGTSISVYIGLITALWDAADFQIVNASLGVDAHTQCGTALAATFTYLMQLRAKFGGSPPRLVVAAGNNRSTLRAPATADGATVVTALDLSGAVAPYCAALTIPAGTATETAPGGTQGDPLGYFANGDPIYGTSFAAGFISGAIAA